MTSKGQPTNRFEYLSTFLYSLAISLIGLLIYLSYSIASPKSNVVDSVAVYVALDSNFTHVWTAPSDWRMMYLAHQEKELV